MRTIRLAMKILRKLSMHPLFGALEIFNLSKMNSKGLADIVQENCLFVYIIKMICDQRWPIELDIFLVVHAILVRSYSNSIGI